MCWSYEATLGFCVFESAVIAYIWCRNVLNDRINVVGHLPILLQEIVRTVCSIAHLYFRHLQTTATCIYSYTHATPPSGGAPFRFLLQLGDCTNCVLIEFESYNIVFFFELFSTNVNSFNFGCGAAWRKTIQPRRAILQTEK